MEDINCKICKRKVNEDHKCYVQIKPKHKDDVKDRKKLLQMYIYFVLNVLRRTVFTFPIYVWLIASVSVAIISLWTSTVSDAKP